MWAILNPQQLLSSSQSGILGKSKEFHDQAKCWCCCVTDFSWEDTTCTLVVWMRNIVQWLMCLNTWSPIYSTVWGCYGAFRRWSLDGENMSMEVSIWWVYPPSHMLSLLPVWQNMINKLPTLDSCFHIFPAITLSHIWNNKTSKLFFSISWFCSWNFYYSNKK